MGIDSVRGLTFSLKDISRRQKQQTLGQAELSGQFSVWSADRAANLFPW
jgi:hypothetical protein